MDALVHLAGDGPALAGLLRPNGRVASTLGLGQDAVGRDDVTVHTVMAAPNAFADFATEALGKLAVTCA